MSALLPLLPEATVLDLYAGSGALGLEALSRGAAHVTFVERAGAALKTLRANLDTLGAAGEATVVRGDALRFVERLEAGSFAIALADPPYDDHAAAALVEAFARCPFARWLWLEHRAAAPLPVLPGARVRRYGDTALTSIPAPQ